MSIERFEAATREWFATAFAAPTPVQERAWDAIAAGGNALVVAPTGSGKTLAAFLWSIDQLIAHPAQRGGGVRVLYVSPLKALAFDVERNLRQPLAGIRAAAQRAGAALAPIEVGLRSGDTPATERRRLAKKPPDILITTPESLYLLLTSQARETLRAVATVIVDEVHAIAGSKRGAHLALSLERLDHLLPRPAQRVGLSATVRPLATAARFLGGGRPVEIVDAPGEKGLDISIVVPAPDLTTLAPRPFTARPRPARRGARARTAPQPDSDDATPVTPPDIWSHVEARVLELIRAHRSTIVFANSRRLAERLCARLNELAGEGIARAHHGSVSHARREEIERALKAGALRAVVATSSLELGIDMGAVDLVVQIEAPTSVASGLQRIGRAGHQVGAVSRGMIFPKYRGDLLECAVVSERMQARDIESIAVPRNPLDVLAQQIVAMVAMDDWPVEELAAVVRRAAPFTDLPTRLLEEVLDMLSGRYPSDAFAGLRARINWDRGAQRLSSRPGARLVAAISGGTIPDRGLYGVYLSGERRSRIGELDEEMVFESRPGEVFLLGASSWRIEEITADRVYVTPAPGQPGKMPFWHGDAPGRPAELGRAHGAFVREVGALPADARSARFAAAGCDTWAGANLGAYLDAQREATGMLPDDRTLLVERFRDAVGDWRLCIHSFFGARVHAPWAQAISARLREQLGSDAQVVYGDDGLVVRIPDGDAPPNADLLFPDPDEVEDLVVGELGASALFAGRFREAAARALLLPRRRPDARAPLWLQRQRASTLLQVAGQHARFPIVLETFRECLQDVFDLPALVDLLSRLRRRELRYVEVETELPSPFAASLQLAYAGAFLYEGDTPLAERRAQALALDRGVLAELMGSEELRELLDPAVLRQLEDELQRRTPERRVRHADQLHDLLRALGDLGEGEIGERTAEPARVGVWLEELATSGRAVRVRVAGAERWIAAEDASRYRDALACALPKDLPESLAQPVDDPVGDLVARFARTHGPFHTADVGARLGLAPAVARDTLQRLATARTLLEGEFRPGASGREWIDVEVLRRLRRRSLAVLRREIEPVPSEALAQLAVAWQGAASEAHATVNAAGLLRIVEQLQGVPLPAAALERQIIAARMPAYTPALLDQLGAAGELVWCGAGAAAHNDGWIVLARPEAAALLLPEPLEITPSPLAQHLLDALRGGGALFFRQLSDAVGGPPDLELLHTLWELVWSGQVTNDTFAPLRAMLRARPARRRGDSQRARPRAVASQSGPAAGAGRWSLTPQRSRPANDDAAATTRRAHTVAEQVLRRHGVVTRGCVNGERLAGGFAALYPILAAFEERGRCRRGYFVEGLGGAQFALPGAVDRMRALAGDDTAARQAVVLAAADPANPYGAALPWPERGAAEQGHRAGRKLGASVVLVGGRLALYLERGGRTLLTYVDDTETQHTAATALAAALRAGTIAPIEIQRIDGDSAAAAPLATALAAAGFRRTHRGYGLGR